MHRFYPVDTAEYSIKIIVTLNGVKVIVTGVAF